MRLLGNEIGKLSVRKKATPPEPDFIKMNKEKTLPEEISLKFSKRVCVCVRLVSHYFVSCVYCGAGFGSDGVVVFQ